MWRCTRRAVTVGAVFVTALAGAACSEEADLPELPPPATAQPPPSPTSAFTPEEQAAIDGAIEVFDLYLTTYVQLATEGVEVLAGEHHEELHQYGDSVITEYSALGLDNNLLQGRVGSGTIEWEFLAVEAVDADGSEHRTGLPTVTFQACLDETGWTLVDEASDEVLEGPGERRLITVGTHYASDQHGALRTEEAWRVSRWEIEESETC